MIKTGEVDLLYVSSVRRHCVCHCNGRVKFEFDDNIKTTYVDPSMKFSIFLTQHNFFFNDVSNDHKLVENTQNIFKCIPYVYRQYRCLYFAHDRW